MVRWGRDSLYAGLARRVCTRGRRAMRSSVCDWRVCAELEGWGCDGGAWCVWCDSGMAVEAQRIEGDGNRGPVSGLLRRQRARGLAR